MCECGRRQLAGQPTDWRVETVQLFLQLFLLLFFPRPSHAGGGILECWNQSESGMPRSGQGARTERGGDEIVKPIGERTRSDY